MPYNQPPYAPMDDIPVATAVYEEDHETSSTSNSVSNARVPPNGTNGRPSTCRNNLIGAVAITGGVAGLIFILYSSYKHIGAAAITGSGLISILYSSHKLIGAAAITGGVTVLIFISYH